MILEFILIFSIGFILGAVFSSYTNSIEFKQDENIIDLKKLKDEPNKLKK